MGRLVTRLLQWATQTRAVACSVPVKMLTVIELKIKRDIKLAGLGESLDRE